jgi:hypothetical protein
MEEYLEEMAKKGWMLEKLGQGIATFKRIQPSKLRFYIDVFKDEGPLVPENTPDSREYRSLCEASGWHFITSQDYLQYFYADEGQNPTPIQTDEELELSLVKKTLLKREFLSIPFMIFLFRNILYDLFFTSYTFFISTTRMALGISFLIFILNNIGMIGYFLAWMIKSNRRVKKGLGMERPNLNAAKIRAFAFIGIQTLTLIVASIFILSDETIRTNEIIFILIIVGMVIAIGNLFRFIVKKKGKAKDDGLYYSFVGAFLVLAFFALMTKLLWGVFMEEDYEYNNVIPKDYPMVKVEELVERDIKGNPWWDFKSNTSPIIPLSYNSRGDINGAYLQISYYRSIEDPFFSKLIFKGKVRELKKYLNNFHQSIMEDEELRKKWQVDELILSETRNTIILRSDQYVLYLKCSLMDFENEELIQTITEEYFIGDEEKF